MVPVSVLDLSPVTTATPGSVALRNSLDLARLADRLGYKRYWVAEHHNLATVGSSTPEIMIGQIAAVTSGIRLGSPAATTRGFGTAEFREVGLMIDEVLEGLSRSNDGANGAVEAAVGARVQALCARFPVYRAR